MKFNHLIQINDPLNPLIDNLTRAQLWRGLVMRAEAPQLFMEHLDECVLSDKTDAAVKRMLRYGELRIHDVVTYETLQRVHYHVPAQGEIPTSSLSMTVEEPEEEAGTEKAFYDQFRRSAYEAADIDTIRVIRELIVKGSVH